MQGHMKRGRFFSRMFSRRWLGGWTLARIGGVDLKVHMSLIVLLLYIILAANMQFPEAVNQSGIDPTLLSGSPFLWSLLLACSLFFSVILHELGHSFAAQLMGVRVNGITLMMMGGISEMERIPEKPYAEFKISIVGPLINFAIAAILIFLGDRVTSSNLAFFCYWVGRMNLVLGIFNLLPAFPLDGGRAFRSLLAVRYGMARATSIMVTVARALAWCLGVIAFLSFNFVLLIIAFFIHSAATSELAISVSRGILKGIPAGRIGTRTPVVDSTHSLDQLAQIMIRSNSRILPVSDATGNIGLISADDLNAIPHESWKTLKISDVMITVSNPVETSQLLDDVAPEIAAAGILPLSEGGKIVGIIRYSDFSELVELKSLQQPNEVEAAA